MGQPWREPHQLVGPIHRRFGDDRSRRNLSPDLGPVQPSAAVQPGNFGLADQRQGCCHSELKGQVKCSLGQAVGCRGQPSHTATPSFEIADSHPAAACKQRRAATVQTEAGCAHTALAATAQKRKHCRIDVQASTTSTVCPSVNVITATSGPLRTSGNLHLPARLSATNGPVSSALRPAVSPAAGVLSRAPAASFGRSLSPAPAGFPRQRPILENLLQSLSLFLRLTSAGTLVSNVILSLGS